VEKRAKEEKLSRLLWKFKLENDNVKDDSETEGGTLKFFIPFYICKNKFNGSIKDIPCDVYIPGTVFFSNKELAERAIKEVCVPFYENENDE